MDLLLWFRVCVCAVKTQERMVKREFEVLNSLNFTGCLAGHLQIKINPIFPGGCI